MAKRGMDRKERIIIILLVLAILLSLVSLIISLSGVNLKIPDKEPQQSSNSASAKIGFVIEASKSNIEGK